MQQHKQLHKLSIISNAEQVLTNPSLICYRNLRWDEHPPPQPPPEKSFLELSRAEAKHLKIEGQNFSQYPVHSDAFRLSVSPTSLLECHPPPLPLPKKMFLELSRAEAKQLKIEGSKLLSIPCA